MTKQQKNKILFQSNTDDFNTMRGMLSDIEMKIVQLSPFHQKEFYKSLQYIILEAWTDACDPNNKFLYKNTSNYNYD